MVVDWLIVGGGIHGVHLAARLLGDAGVRPDDLRIVDPGSRLLRRWRTCTATTGMSHLRSAAVHHLDLNPWSLQRFAGKRRQRKPGMFAPPYDRPSLELFDAHCDRVVEDFGLADQHIQDRVTACAVGPHDVTVRLASERELTASKLVLAIGASEQPLWPDGIPRDAERVHHVFDPGFDDWPTSRETVAVMGGGISAAQVALRLLGEEHRVHLISRHPLRQHQFDSDPGWLGAKYMTGFSRERDLDRRRETITKARHKGSVPPDVFRPLCRAIDKRQLRWHECDVDGVDSGPDSVRVRLATGTSLQVDRILLATGFTSERPGGPMIDELAESASLPCANCGYPIVDTSLRWHPRIFVSGPLAELELGPAARNIAGARRAGDRIVAAVDAVTSTHSVRTHA